MSPSRSETGGWTPLVLMQMLAAVLLAAVLASEAGVRMPSPVPAGREMQRPVPPATATLPHQPLLWSAEPVSAES